MASIARFVPLGSAIAGGSPRSSQGPSQGNMGEDAPPTSTKEEVTSGPANMATESRGIASAAASQVADIGEQSIPRCMGIRPPKEPPRRRRTDFVSSKAQQAKESIKDNVNDFK